MSISSYSFLPWLRQGLASQVSAGDLDSSVLLRASIQVNLTITGRKSDGSTLTEAISKPVQLYGPGDIVGIDSQAIVRSEPRNWITDFEPNYLAHIEFYEEDFPWRYTPAAPDTTLHRLRPWITLVVLEDTTEFEEVAQTSNRPLGLFKLLGDAADLFPPAEQLWAWAHVHVNRSILASDAEIQSTQSSALLGSLEQTLKENRDLAFSRLVCPRKLKPNTAYHAFVIPSFESGRLAGLGLDPAQAPFATFSAWGTYPSGAPAEAGHYPYYHRWYFRTGQVGDFESLVRLLKPRPMDARVGRRDMDVQRPHPYLPGIEDPDLGGVLKLGGALRVPLDTLKPEDRAEVEKYEAWSTPYPHPFQEGLAELINLSDDYDTTQPDLANQQTSLPAVQGDPDPLITPPLYGRWHALTSRLLENQDGTPVANPGNWVHELNLDPRFRVAAGFGTKVVQTNQEAYMNAAWEQVGAILEANRRIRLAQLAQGALFSWFQRNLKPLEANRTEKVFTLTAPLHKRIVLQGKTAHFQVLQSPAPPVLTSAPMRRMVRPQGRLMKRLTFTPGQPFEKLISRVNAGEVHPAPPKVTPPGVVTVDQAVTPALPAGAPGFWGKLLQKHSWLRWLPLMLALLIAGVLALLHMLNIYPLNLYSLSGAGAVLVAMIVFFIRLYQLANRVYAGSTLLEDHQTPEAVAQLPKSPDFRIAMPGDPLTPKQGVRDSTEAIRFKAGLKDLYRTLEASTQAAAVPASVQLNLAPMIQATLLALHPDKTLPQRTWAHIILPARIREAIGEQFVEAMTYPEIDLPMYKPLADLSAELFLPNIQMIENNTISLLETNQKFIESYMVGLNHEFARELLWREYPTDQRGSYFRQFWDVKSVFNEANLDAETLREQLRDIPPLHRWPAASRLGDHDHRETGGESEEELTLVIRGELLKKYPNAVIYAQRAKWQLKSDGKIDNTKERQLEGLDADANLDNIPPNVIKTPLYDAKVDPDIYFFGFDLTASEAKGGTGENPGDSPGWFFVIKERPSEPRFGLDISRSGPLNTWNDLAWSDLLPGDSDGQHLRIEAGMPVFNSLSAPGAADQEKLVQHNEDNLLQLNAAANSAVLAYILYQAPVLVAVHASEMLPK